MVVIVVGVRSGSRGGRLPWYLFALGLTVFIAGDVSPTTTRALRRELPFPPEADARLPGRVPGRHRGAAPADPPPQPGRDRASLSTRSSVTVGAGRAVLGHPDRARGARRRPRAPLKLVSSPTRWWTSCSGRRVRLAVGAGRRAPSFYLLAPSWPRSSSPTRSTATSSSTGGFETGNWLEGGWMTFYVLFGAAALHPSMSPALRAGARPRGELHLAGLLVLGAATVLAPAILAARAVLDRGTESSSRRGVDRPVVLVIVRMSGLVRRQQSAAEREGRCARPAPALASARSREDIYAAARSRPPRGRCGLDVAPYLVADVGERSPRSRPRTATSRCPAWRASPSTPRSRRLDQPGAVTRGPVRRATARAGRRRPGEPFGLLRRAASRRAARPARVSGAAAPPASGQEGLAALAAQVALALESAALTEDLQSQRGAVPLARAALLRRGHGHRSRHHGHLRRAHRSSACSATGPTALGRRFAELVHPDDRARVLSFLLDGRRAPRPARVPAAPRRRDVAPRPDAEDRPARRSQRGRHRAHDPRHVRAQGLRGPARPPGLP